ERSKHFGHLQSGHAVQKTHLWSFGMELCLHFMNGNNRWRMGNERNNVIRSHRCNMHSRQI
ncbi:unnamed protein product, partial [Musa hybrid cultivar]